MYAPFRIVRVHPESPLARCPERDLREIPSLFVGGPLDCCHLVEEHVSLQPEEERDETREGGRRKESSWIKRTIGKKQKQH